MGMFDTVLVPCPKCGELSEFQSKGADCLRGNVYALDTAPADVLSDVNRHAPNTCSSCQTVFNVKLIITAVPVALHGSINADAHNPE